MQTESFQKRDKATMFTLEIVCIHDIQCVGERGTLKALGAGCNALQKHLLQWTLIHDSEELLNLESAI